MPAALLHFCEFGPFRVGVFDRHQHDENGIQLSGTRPIWIATATFNSAGQGPSSTSTYLTAKDLTSSATFYRLVFSNSRPNTYLYNVSVKGSDTGIGLVPGEFDRAPGGEAFDDDPNGRVRWESNVPTPENLNGVPLEWTESLGPGAMWGGRIPPLYGHFPTTLVWAGVTNNHMETGLSTNTAYGRMVTGGDIWRERASFPTPLRPTLMPWSRGRLLSAKSGKAPLR